MTLSVSVFQGFRYPLFMTLVHLTVNFCLSALTRRAMQCWTGKPRILLSWSDYLHKVAPTGEIWEFYLTVQRAAQSMRRTDD